MLSWQSLMDIADHLQFRLGTPQAMGSFAHDPCHQHPLDGRGQSITTCPVDRTTTLSSSSTHYTPSEPQQPIGNDGNAYRCWDHGCGGRHFSCRGNYQRHVKERSHRSRRFSCPGCGLLFSRSTARNLHFRRKRCKQHIADQDTTGLHSHPHDENAEHGPTSAPPTQLNTNLAIARHGIPAALDPSSERLHTTSSPAYDINLHNQRQESDLYLHAYRDPCDASQCSSTSMRCSLPEGDSFGHYSTPQYSPSQIPFGSDLGMEAWDNDGAYLADDDTSPKAASSDPMKGTYDCLDPAYLPYTEILSTLPSCGTEEASRYSRAIAEGPLLDDSNGATLAAAWL